MIVPQFIRAFYFLLTIAICCSSCLITAHTLEKAKLDRKPVKVDSIYNAYYDSANTLHVVYKLKRKEGFYSIATPIDSIIVNYRKSKRLKLIDTIANNNISGVLYEDNLKTKNEYQRIIVLDSAKYIGSNFTAYKNQQTNDTLNPTVVSFYKQRFMVPLVNKKDYYVSYTKTKAVAFLVTRINDSSNIKEDYLITIAPTKHRYRRYLLTPLTVVADIITAPIQVVLVIIAFSKIPLS